jgi:hypothetical protein
MNPQGLLALAAASTSGQGCPPRGRSSTHTKDALTLRPEERVPPWPQDLDASRSMGSGRTAVADREPSAKKIKSRVGYLPLCHGLGLPPGA